MNTGARMPVILHEALMVLIRCYVSCMYQSKTMRRMPTQISHFRLLPEESYLVHPSSQPSGTA